ncbi:hypothetical protein SBV1_1700023 [Verrucomicrobia bacterium]|nr:hypothetical protein SBV1_1700023 [Verrucomicrobiota bacterium]
MPSDEERQREIKTIREIQEKRANWPFIDDDEAVA